MELTADEDLVLFECLSRTDGDEDQVSSPAGQCQPQGAVPERKGLTPVDEAEVTRRYGVPGRRYADFAILRGDPSDGLPGLAGVGDKKAAELVQRYDGLDGLLASDRLSPTDRDYVERARQVVRPVANLPIDLPPGCRPSYPADPERAQALSER